MLSTGAKPHFRRAIHTGRRSVRVSPRKDIIPLGRGRVGRSTMVDGHRDRAKAGGEEEEGECKKVVARTRAFAAFYKLFN